MVVKIGQIAHTSFLTLQCHALDALSNQPVLNDTDSINTLKSLKEITGIPEINSNQVKKNLVNHIALRARQYDWFAKSFIEEHPEAAIVNIGCGMDNRCKRIDNGKILFYDLDLPEIIAIKKQIIAPTERYRQLARSVFEFDWMNEIEREHVFLLAEGVFMYCRATDVENLLWELQKSFSNSEIVFEVFSSKWLKGWRGKIMAIKMKKELKLGEETIFKFGISDSNEIENWNSGYKLLQDWSYLDEEEADIPLRNIFQKMDIFRKIQWTVHYTLGSN